MNHSPLDARLPHRFFRISGPPLRLLAALVAAACGLGGVTPRAATPPAPVAYYVAPDGDDARDGLAPERAWRTLERVNAATPAPGGKVLFRRGGLWRGQLIPRGGDAAGPVTYGAYGAGDKPALLGSVALNDPADWKGAGPNLWVTAGQFPVDVGNIIFDGGAAWGVKRWSPAELKADLEYWYDGQGRTVTLFSRENPARRYRSLELALRRHIIDESGKSFLIYENLALRYGAAHGIGGGGTHHIIVRDCDISWIGGGHQNTRPDGKPVRYGNGVEFWGPAHDNLVERCRLWEVYDAALTNQNKGATVLQANITYRHNVIWNCEYSFEYWNRPAASQTRDITFEHNTCFGAGRGWGHAQRPDPAGRHLCFYTNDCRTSGLAIRDNIFCDAANVAFDALWWKPETLADREVIRLERNCWFQPAGAMIRLRGREYTQAQFTAYQRETGQDAGSLAADPRLADPRKLDFRLRPDSPCPAAGAPALAE